jgi:hypothetical protein
MYTPSKQKETELNTWLFAATASGSSIEKTFALAMDGGLIVRPYFDARENVYRSRNQNNNLKSGDNLILAFVSDGKVVDSAAFVLTEETAGTRLSDIADKIDGIAGRDFPSVFSVSDSSDKRFTDSGYEDSMQDPKLNCWVCLNVEDSHKELDEAALQAAFSERAGKFSTINRIEANVFEESSPKSESSATELSGSDVSAPQAKNPGANKPSNQQIENVNPRKVGDDSLKPRTAVGIDFSGGKDAQNKIWIAEVVWKPAGGLQLTKLANGFSFDALQKELARKRSADILLDFPFGLARQTCTNLKLSPEANYGDIWKKVASFKNAEDFRHAARAGLVGPGSERPHKRTVDQEMKTPFAPINLRMFRQTYFGQAKVLSGAEQSQNHICFLPWDDFNATVNHPRVGEGCPASMLKRMGWQSDGYKGKQPTCKEARESLLRQLKDTVQLTLTDSHAKLVLDDTEGDALDAVLLAVAAAHLSDIELEAGRQHSQSHKTEAFVYLGLDLLGGQTPDA